MGAITWRNVDTPSFGDSNRLSFLGQQTVNQGFDKFNEINTNAYMDALAEAKTPEEFQAKQAFLAQMRQGFGAQGDATAMRAAEDSRLALLQGRATAQYAFDNAKVDQAEAPIRDAVASLTARGENQAARSMAAMLTRKQGEAQQAITNQENQDTQRAQQNIKFGFDLEKQEQERKMNPLELEFKSADTDYRKALAEDARARAGESKKAKDPSKLSAKLHDAYISELEKNSSFSAGTLDTKEGMDNFIGWVNKNVPNPSEKADILHNMSKLAQEGIGGVDDKGNAIKMPLPVSAAILSVGSATDSVGLIPGWSRRGDDARNILTKYMKDNAKTVLKEHFTIEDAKGAKFKALEGSADTQATEDSGEDTRVHPKLNDPIWMAQQQEKARLNNAKLDPEVKQRLGIKD